MKNILLLWLLFTSIISRAQRPVCEEFLVRKTSLNEISSALKNNTAALANNPPLNKKNELLSDRKSLYKSFQQSSKECATLLQQCMASQPANSQTELLRKYQLAKYYINAKDCSQAHGWLSQCKQHPKINELTVNNKPLLNAVNFLSSQCTNSNNAPKEEYLNIMYGGKGLYFALDRVDDVDDQPYNAEELEEFAYRALTKKQADQSVKNYAALSPDKTIYYHFPFIIVGGPGQFAASAVIPEKAVPGKQDAADTTDLAISRVAALKNIYEQIISPAFRHLAVTYFNKLQFKNVLPVYLTGGDFDQKSYDEFISFSQKVHFRSAGPRVAYYSPYDKSVMAWMTTGGGTMLHELVHALMDNEFPAAPAWLSEGIASMYEEIDMNGYVPKDNYRLYYVEKAKDVYGCHLPIEKMLALPTVDFNGQKASMLYSAYARYFALYLHSENLLQSFYKQLRTATTPSFAVQLQLLQQVSGKPIDSLQTAFEEWLAKRKLPAKWYGLRNNIYDYLYRLDRNFWTCTQ